MNNDKSESLEAMLPLEGAELAQVEGGIMNCLPPRTIIVMPKLPGPTCPPFPTPLPSWVRGLM